MFDNLSVLFIKPICYGATFGVDFVGERDGLIRRSENAFPRDASHEFCEFSCTAVSRTEFVIKTFSRSLVTGVTNFTLEDGNLRVRWVSGPKSVTSTAGRGRGRWKVWHKVSAEARRNVATRGGVDSVAQDLFTR